MAADHADFPQFTHLGLDTSSLISSGWPFPGVQLSNLAAVCGQLDLPILIPELVLQEAEAEWHRKTAEAVVKAKEVLKSLGGKLPHWSPTEIGLPDKAASATSYATALASLETVWKWSSPPLPELSLSEAVSHSVKHVPPFLGGDSSFRDALIAASIFGAVGAGAVVALVSGDDFFGKPAVTEAAAAAGITVVVFSKIAEASAALEAQLKYTNMAQVLAAWQSEDARLHVALEADRARLEEFVQANLEVPEYPGGGFERIEALHRVRVIRIESAQMSRYGETNHDGIADLTLKLEVTLHRYSPGTDRSMRIGQSAREVAPIFGETHMSLAEIDGAATVSVTVTWPDNEDDSPTIGYTSVSFGKPGDQLSRYLLRTMRGRS